MKQINEVIDKHGRWPSAIENMIIKPA